MVMQIDRRSMILGGAWGIGALALPAGQALAAELIGARGFTHAVASGEPGADSMLLWTRYVPASDAESVRLDVEIAIDPDFARTVDIHRKPGYDPAELFTDPSLGPIRLRLRIASRLLAKKLGQRTLMDVIALNGDQVRGSHGRLPETEADGPLFLSSSPVGKRGPLRWSVHQAARRLPPWPRAARPCWSARDSSAR